MASMAFKSRDLGNGVLLVYAVHDHIAPSALEWGSYLDTSREAMRDIRPAHVVTFVATDGGAPDAVQRRELIEAIQDETEGELSRIHTAVLSESLIVRAVVRALSWFIEDIALFAPSDVRDALAFIGVPSELVPHVRADLEELAPLVPGAHTVYSVIAALGDQGTPP